MLAAYRQLARPLAAADLAGLAALTSEAIGGLLEVSGAPAHEIAAFTHATALRIEAVNLFARRMEFAPPTEHLLTQGGDARIKIDPRTGRNGYGSSARPTLGEIGFSSSTASCVSTHAYDSVDAMRHRLLAATSTFDDEIERIRTEVSLRSGAHNAAGTAIVLTASGTDAELAALALSLARDGRPLTSIVISPEETGSGVPQATLGRHFSTETALGASVKPGASIEGFAAGRVQSINIAIREANGSARPLGDVRDELFAATQVAIAGGRGVLLHVLDAAKTGIGAPDLGDVAALTERFGDAIDVVVDACQTRLGPEAVAAYLAQGWLVQITGSKFWGGPPFSGALLVPAQFLARAERLGPLLAPLGGYMARNEWPAAFDAARQALPDTHNLGLLSRWQAAICEAERFACVTPAGATALTRDYMAAVRDALTEYPELLPVDGVPIDHTAICANDTWKDLRSIVPFVPTRGPARTPLTFDEAKLLHQSLARDVSAAITRCAVGDGQRRLAAQPCHLGQPVKMGTPEGGATGALRLCASTRTLVAMAQPGGMEGLERDLATVLAKTRLLLTHLDALKT